MQSPPTMAVSTTSSSDVPSVADSAEPTFSPSFFHLDIRSYADFWPRSQAPVAAPTSTSTSTPTSSLVAPTPKDATQPAPAGASRARMPRKNKEAAEAADEDGKAHRSSLACMECRLAKVSTRPHGRLGSALAGQRLNQTPTRARSFFRSLTRADTLHPAASTGTSARIIQ